MLRFINDGEVRILIILVVNFWGGFWILLLLFLDARVFPCLNFCLNWRKIFWSKISVFLGTILKKVLEDDRRQEADITGWYVVHVDIMKQNTQRIIWSRRRCWAWNVLEKKKKSWFFVIILQIQSIKEHLVSGCENFLKIQLKFGEREKFDDI